MTKDVRYVCVIFIEFTDQGGEVRVVVGVVVRWRGGVMVCAGYG